MSRSQEEVLAVVTDCIRSTINEDWIQLVEIEEETRFYEDLEIESIEFVKITLTIQKHFDTDLGIVAWLSAKKIQELIGLSVGELSHYIFSKQNQN
jgi:acyl carrier protein